jgi:hypothetical protein
MNEPVTMAQPKLTLYLDVVSPFAYLAYYATRVCCSMYQYLSFTPLLCHMVCVASRW